MNLRFAAPLALCLAFAGDSLAAVSPAQRCEGAKLRILTRSIHELLGCVSRAAAFGIDVKAGCLDDATTRLADGFADEILVGGCAASDDAVVVEQAVDAMVNRLVSALDVSADVDPCAGRKMRAASKRIGAEFDCRRVASRRGDAVDPACIADASGKMAAAFARLEDGLACNTSGDAPMLETQMGEFVAFVAAAIAGTAPDAKPSGLAAMLDAAVVELSWTNPDPGSGRTHAKLLRRLNTPPAGPADPEASELLFAASTSATDDLTGLLPDTATVARTYHYAVFACTPAGTCETAGSHTTFTPTLTQVLAAGGYVLHWRHASANVCADRTDLGTAATTSVPDWWKSCDADCGTATARQLNPAGVSESVAIGDAFRARGIPVGRVLTSEFCRNVETAALMNFGPTLEEVPGLTFFVYDEGTRCALSFAMLAEAPTPGTNTALIGHSGVSCPPLSSLAWAEAAVFKPDGLGGSLFVARVLAADWMTLP